MFLFLVLQASFSKILADLLQLPPWSKDTDVFRLKLNGLTACKLFPLYFTLPLLPEWSFKNINHNPTPHHRVNFPDLFTSAYLCHHTLSPSCHYLLDRQVGLFIKCSFSIPLVLLSLVLHRQHHLTESLFTAIIFLRIQAGYAQPRSSGYSAAT